MEGDYTQGYGVVHKPKVVVWSKNNCTYCNQAKLLLKQKGYEYEERNVEESIWTRAQFFDAVPNARTFPQVFFDKKLIGGFTELKAHLS